MVVDCGSLQVGYRRLAHGFEKAAAVPEFVARVCILRR